MMTSQRLNPYIGPRSFRTGETLYGRDRELNELLDLLIAERVVLLYAPSGAGKSSLVQAALVPRLGEEGFRVLPVMRVSQEPPSSVTNQAGFNRYVFSLLLSLEEALPDKEQLPESELAGLTLAAYLDRRAAAKTADDPKCDVLIFDQFEEILTVNPVDQDTKVEFFAQVGQALRDRNRWALFAMREDYIAGLDRYLRPLPTRLNNRFRLDMLEEAAARSAMQQPAKQIGVDFTDAAAHKLANDLRKVRVQRADGTTEEQLGLYVEPVQLQVVCYRLWDRLPTDAQQIVEADVAAVGNVDSALSDYYAERVVGAAHDTGIRERGIRDWVEQQLITAQGIRGQVLQGPDQGLDSRAVQKLLDAYLVRAEKRRGATWLELAHDRLIAPVQANNAAWREANLSTLQRQAALWEKQNRLDGLLLRERALSEAEDWAEAHSAELTSIEQDYLSDCRKARAAAQRERRNSRLIKGLAVVALVALVVAIAGVIMARQQQQLSRSRELAAIAMNQIDKDPERGLLIAIEAGQAADTYEAQDALRQLLAAPKASAVLRGHGGWISVTFSPDGQRVVTTGCEKTDATSGNCLEGTVRVWDAATGKELAVLRKRKGVIHSTAFSPDSQWVVTAGCDKTDTTTSICLEGTAQVWDASTGKELAVLRGHAGRVWSAAFSPNGQRVVTTGCEKADATTGGCLESTARVWDASTGQELAVLRGHEGWVNSAAFSPDGRRVVTAGCDKTDTTDGCLEGTARLWDAATGKPLAVLRGHEGRVTSPAFSPDGQRIVTASADHTARVWDAATGKEVAVLRGHEDVVLSAAFSPDGQRIVTASDDQTARVWDAATGRQMAVLRGHEGAVRSAAFSPDSQRVVTAGCDKPETTLRNCLEGTARVWDTTLGQALAVLRGHAGGVWSAAFSPDGQRVVTAGCDKRDTTSTFSDCLEGTARVWDAATGQELAVLRGYEGWVTSAAFSPDGQRVVMAGCDKLETNSGNCLEGTARAWEAVTGQALAVLRGHEGLVTGATFSPDGQRIVTAGCEKTNTSGHCLEETARLWDAATGQAQAVLRGHEGWVSSAAFSPDGKRVVTAGCDKADPVGISGCLEGTARVWDAATGQTLAVLRGHEDLLISAAFSPDGQRVVTAGCDKPDPVVSGGCLEGIARVWDAAMDKELAVLRGHKGLVLHAAFSPDGQRIVTVSRDRTARLWEAATGKELAVLRGHGAEVNSAAFSPDGQRLVTASGDGTVRLWDATTGRELATLRGHEGGVNSAAFSPDGQRIVTAGYDGTVRIYLVHTADLVKLAQTRVTRKLTCAERVQYLREDVVCPTPTPQATPAP